MKLTALILLIACMHLSAATYSQEKITYSARNKALERVLTELEKKSQYRFVYSPENIPTKREFSINVKEQAFTEVLHQLFEGTGLVYSISEKGLIVISNTKIDITVTGKVLDEQQRPIPGAIIKVKDNGKAAVTNTDGTYSIKAPDQGTLIFSSLGYKTVEQAVAGRTSISVVLAVEENKLNEVVVTALGIKRQEKSLGYSVQKVSGEELQKVKGVDVGTSLTGKVAGMLVKNSTEFFEAPVITLRGASPLIIIDGVPYGNLTLRDISPDDIQSIDVLKGATASALYGARGGSGAVMITTKKGSSKKGLEVTINSNTMFEAGFLALPKVQSSYSAGSGGKYNTDDYVWGDKLDIGRRAMQWDPISKSMQDMELRSIGKDNFKNFLESSFVTNNNVSISQSGENGSFRASVSNIFNKGQYPNTKLNKTMFSLGGELKIDDKFSMDASMAYNKRTAPNIAGKGYNSQGYIYNILVWTGPEYDLRQYRDYWVTPDIKQNWAYKNWYDNPYMAAYEKLQGIDEDVFNGSMSAKYKLTPWMTALFRSGLDYYVKKDERRNPIGINSIRGWDSKGMYRLAKTNGYSLNNDLLLMFDQKVSKDFRVEGVLGGSIYYYQDESITASTRGGLSIPGFYSLKSSVERPDVSNSIYKKQVNSLYGKATISYKNLAYWDITGRNDWSSTLPSSTRSYFYPSTGLSVITSELFNGPSWLDFWKVRGSWTVSKNDLGVYETNQAYSTTVGAWDSYNSAKFPTSLRGEDVKPVTSRTYEYGTAANFLKNRLRIDATYFNKYTYNRAINATISSASGFSSKLTNIDETLERRGWELTLGGTIIKKKDLQWDATINWSTTHVYYKNLDPVYSANKPWVQPGARYDAYVTKDWDRDPSGNIIYRNGYPITSDYDSVFGFSDPKWIWGFTNTFTYKNFTLNLSFDGRIGGLSYSTTNSSLWDSGSHIDSDNEYRYQEVVNGKNTFVGDGVTVVSGTVQRDQFGRIIPGTDTRVFAKNGEVVSYESYIHEYSGGSQNIWDETFIKLREVALSYQFSPRIAKKMGMKNASVGFVGQNVFLWTKQYRFSDPDKASEDLNSPSLRYLGVNFQFTF